MLFEALASKRYSIALAIKARTFSVTHFRKYISKAIEFDFEVKASKSSGESSREITCEIQVFIRLGQPLTGA
jgi:hypothetical protein